MCGIFASFSIDKLNELSKLNSYRGSHSFSVFNCDSGELYKDFGAFNPSTLNNGYNICHVQAPTTSEKSIDNIHPSTIENTHLWHNGIIKDFSIDELNHIFNTNEKWDTKLLHYIMIQDFTILSKVNGSFACVYYNQGKVFVFRNEISPIFYDSDLNISSVKFDGSMSLPANVIFELDINNKELIRTANTFSTLENPYFFG